MSNKKKKTKQKHNGSKAIRNLWILFGSVLLLVVLFFTLVATGVFGTMPTFEELENPRTNLATEIISADGKVLGTYYIENRSNVHYSELSHYMPEALISIEDERFTEHSGIDEKALFRVAFGVLTGRKKGGGSTITQQLAKNLFPRGENLSTPKLVLRKFQEWITATKLEHNYSKEEIIAMYLNTVAFGHNAYGIRSAASTFFDKSPKDLNIEECALMAGVVNAPTRFSPVRNPELSLGRRNLVLKKMAENGFITLAEYDSISQIPLDMSHFSVKDHNSGQATYFREFLRGYLTAWADTTFRADGTPYNIYRDGLLYRLVQEGTTCLDENAPMGGHCYQVAVLCEGGDSGERSNESCATAGPCYPPRNLDYELTSNFKVKLMWESPQLNDGLSGYYLFRKEGDGEYHRIKSLNASAVSFTDNSANQEGHYYYRLYAYYGALDCTSAPANRHYYDNVFELHVYYSPTGMDENEAQVKVYPNPTKSLITVEAEGMTAVSVYNTLGQCVLQKEVDGNQTTVDLQHASEGLYMLRIKTEQGIISKRITLKH